MSSDEDVVQVDGVSDDEEYGTRTPARVRDPKMPSSEEVEQHNLTHLPPRSWCLHCVRGRGEATPHRSADRSNDAVPELHLDYCFMGKKDETAQPILVARDRDTRMTLSFLTKSKGAADEHVISRILSFMKEIGLTGDVIMKCDQESSIKAVVDKVSEKREGRTIFEHSPVRSSGSNGVIERGIKDVEYQIRSMKSALDNRLGTDLPMTSNILPWLIEFASVLLNRYLVGNDGKTSYERLKRESHRTCWVLSWPRSYISGGFHYQADLPNLRVFGRQECSWATRAILANSWSSTAKAHTRRGT